MFRWVYDSLNDGAWPTTVIWDKCCLRPLEKWEMWALNCEVDVGNRQECTCNHPLSWRLALRLLFWYLTNSRCCANNATVSVQSPNDLDVKDTKMRAVCC